MKNKLVKSILLMSLSVMMVASNVGGVLKVDAAMASATNGIVNFNRGNAQITIQGNGGQSLTGKEFHIYRLFGAENSVGNESINYTFNPEYKLALQTIVGKKLSIATAEVTEYQVIDYIQSLNKNQVEGAYATQTPEGSYSDFRYFIEELRDIIVSQGITGDVVSVTSPSADNEIVIQGLEYGYYLVDETSAVGDTHSAASLCIVNTANPDASVVVKSDYTGIVKKIQEDDNKTEIGNDGWNDIADYEIGQTVPYTMSSVIPNINGYHTYYYAWHDVMDEALTFNPHTVQIEIRDDESGESYYLEQSEFKVIENPGNGDTFMVEVSDIKKIVDREFDNMNALNENKYGQDVILTYTATLNDKAAKDMGRPGFENDVRLEFSNDPDSTGKESTGFTPWDTVVCFTYQVDVLKTNNHDLELADARFRLYYDAECTKEVFVKQTEDGYNVINYDSLSGATNTVIPTEMVTDANGSIIINGLDDGTYYLKETAAPVGYRKLLDPIVITVNATFTNYRNDYVKGDGATDKTLTKLEAMAHIKTFLDGIYEEEDVVLETNVDTGKINITVINAVGKKLPVTGSILTPIIIAAGAGLVGYSFRRRKEEE